MLSFIENYSNHDLKKLTLISILQVKKCMLAKNPKITIHKQN